ncbi:MAG: transposase [Candidatus Levybacteria bacterium]|nr:transposase [Candidatus Levybacteria bacterium]
MSKMTYNTRFSRYKQYAKDTYYHIYNRGNGKQDIFHNKDDYLFYINRLEKNIQKHDVELICYILMPNHIHLLAKQKTDTPIHKFISSLHTSYSMYFNKKHGHVGHLFQDRFKQVIVTSEEQLLYLTKYIHRNPVEAGMTSLPSDYPWSSYHEYVRVLPWMLCKKDIIMGILGTPEEMFSLKYIDFCNGELSDKEKSHLEEAAMETF